MLIISPKHGTSFWNGVTQNTRGWGGDEGNIESLVLWSQLGQNYSVDLAAG